MGLEPMIVRFCKPLPLPLGHHDIERATGIEPVIFWLGTRCSTTEPRPQNYLGFGGGIEPT